MAIIYQHGDGEGFYLASAMMGNPICARTFDTPEDALEWAYRNGIEVYQPNEED